MKIRALPAEEGGDTMIEESIQAVKKAEMDADQTLADAAAEAAEIVRQAEADAEQKMEDARQAVKSEAEARLADAKAKGDALLQKAQEELVREKELLQTLAEPKKSIAVDRVIEVVLQ